MDKLEKAIAGASKIRFTAVETTVVSKALEARHLCGPVAGAALAEMLTVAALLSSDAASEDESVMLRMSVSGALGGALVEVTGAGCMRGFTNRKTIDDLDGLLPVDTTPAWGASGAAQVVTSLPGKILNQAVLHVNPPLPRVVAARYFNQSMQVPTACAIAVTAGSGGMISARGLLAQRMVDSDVPAFVHVLECFEDGRVQARLLEQGGHHPIGVVAFRELFMLPDIEVHEMRPLMFQCRCSRERMIAVLETLSREELEAQVAANQPQDITCHMCGNTCSVSVAEMRKVLARKAEASPGAAQEMP